MTANQSTAAPAKGSQSTLRYSILPVIKEAGEAWHIIGTGFFIGQSMLVSATHVLKDVVDKDGMQICPVFVFHFLPDDKYIIRPIRRFCTHPTSDISLGVLAEARHNRTGELLTNSTMIVTKTCERMGARIGTWAYCDTTINSTAKLHTIHFSPNFYFGNLEEYFPVQRDCVMIPFPCYRGSIRLLGGASGGPVVNTHTGHAFGVNCTGFDGTDVSYYASLEIIEELCVYDVEMKGRKYNQVMVQGLIAEGYIQCV